MRARRARGAHRGAKAPQVNSLLLGAFVVASFLLTVRLGGLLCGYAASRWSHLLGQSSRRQAALGLLPLALGAAVALSIVPITAVVGSCHCLSHPHHLHLCFEHAGFSWSLLMMVAAGVVALGFSLRALTSFVAELRRARRWAGTLSGPTFEQAGITVSLTGTLRMRAVTVGVVTPRVIVGEALWAKLGDEERHAIVAHERAHALRRDPLTLLALRLAACLMPAVAGQRLVADWRRTAEVACDAAAAQSIGDPYLLADTLVTCGRLQLADGDAEPCGVLAAADPSDLELRVKCLLDQSLVPSFAGGSDLARAGGWMLLVVAVIVGLGGSAAHHGIETVLGWTV